MMGFKMAGMLDCRKPHYWAIACWLRYSTPWWQHNCRSKVALWALLTCAAWGTTYYDQCQSSTTSTVVKAPLVRALLVKRRYITYLALPLPLYVVLGCWINIAIPNILIDVQIMAKNRNSRWRPSAILELLYHHIGPPTKSFLWVTSACQILC